LAQEKRVVKQPKQVERKPAKSSRQYNRQARLRSLAILVVIVAIAGAIGVETLNLTVVKAAEIRALEKYITTVKTNNDLLQVKVDQLRSIGHIESSALAMGMEKPEGTVYISQNIAAFSKQTDTSAGQKEVASQPENNNSISTQLSRLITGFFASNQS
jgi:hypothetical protein